MKQNQTKGIIVRALMSLLNEKPVDKITVRDIVERCGVNRNTFYYHFQDIPGVVDYAMHQEVDRVMGQDMAPQSFYETALVLVEYLEKNRKALLHIYRSLRREAFLSYQHSMCVYIMEQYLCHSPEVGGLGEEEKKEIFFYGCCFLQGMVIDWMEAGMCYDLRGRLQALPELLGINIRAN